MKTLSGSFVRGLLVMAIAGITTANVARAGDFDTLNRSDCEQMAQLAYDLAKEAESFIKNDPNSGEVLVNTEELSALYFAKVQEYKGKGFHEIFTFTFTLPLYGPQEGKDKVFDACVKSLNEVSL